MIIHILIKNKFGEFKSKNIEIDNEDYEKIIELSRSFHISGYEMDTDDGFVVIPPEIIKESILIIKINEAT